jgi:hypothetical protein
VPGGSQVANRPVRVWADVHGVVGQMGIAQQVLQCAVGGVPSSS